VAQNPAVEFAQRRQENLRFFSQTYPAIYNHLKDYRLTRAEVVISPEDNEVDLWMDGESLYQGKGKEHGHQGVTLFRETFKPGEMLPSLPPVWPGDYHHPRFAHRAIDAAAKLSPVQKDTFRAYPIPNFYPLVVFQGVGLGYQIQELVTACDVENALIIEPDVEIFAASLLTVDWAKVCNRFQPAGRSIRFLIGAEHTEEGIWPVLVRHLMHFTPIFPIMNLFLNERGDPVMDSVAKRLNREAVATLSTWGHYDDEVRQMNNAIHAFHEKISIIPDKGSIRSDLPVLVVGSGPSIDGRIEDIKRHSGKALIVSAGTGLRALLENDIYPDFHVESESDFMTYRITSSYDSEKMKKIRIIASSQVCPLIWSLFGDQMLFFKEENPIGHIFGKSEKRIAQGTPTCTNAALALCVQLGLRNFYLFGMDFGFKDHAKHHSSGSVFMKSENQELKSQLQERARKRFKSTFKVDGVDPEQPVYTNAIYFTAKRSVENLILVTDKPENTEFSYQNCSDGAEIEGAPWLDKEAFNQCVSEQGSAAELDKVINKLFGGNRESVDLENLDKKLESIERKLADIASYTGKLCGNRLRGKKDITRLSSELSRYLEGTLIEEDKGFYYMIRGAIRHFLYVGFSHSLAMQDDKAIAVFLSGWKKAFTACMSALPEHFRSVTNKTYDLEADPWVRSSIHDPEEGTELEATEQQ